jgi:hypothetical protein
MRLPSPLAAYRRWQQGMVRVLGEIETSLQATKTYWTHHEGAIWMMLVTIGLLWIVALAVSFLL